MAGETKPYRFLLRMPVELGQRLRDAAERADRSLNREIVERLEASVLEDQRATRATRARSFDGGRFMTRRRRQALVAVALALLSTALVAGAVTLSGKRPTPSSPAAGGAFPAAFGQHLSNLRSAPQSTNPGGPASWEEEQDLARAHPAENVAGQWIAAARAGWAGTKGRDFPSGKGRKGTWTSVGPSTALYPISPFRTRDLYVAGKYEAGGRMTDVAIAPTCKPGKCRLYVGAAGGGVWRTDNALAGSPNWEFISGSFALNAIGAITLDPRDPTGNTLWVGTGEATVSGASAAGVGIYKTTDGGATWTQLGVNEFGNRGIGTIALHPTDPNVVYVSTTRAVRGLSSTTGAGVVSVIPGAAKWGLYKSSDGGQTWTFIHNGSADENACTGNATEAGGGTPCSPRGVRVVAVDPNDPNVVYASSYARGVWRSPDGGANWTQIFAPIAPGPASGFTERPEFALADLGTKTRMYLQIGETGLLDSTFHVTDDASGAATFTQKSSPDITKTGWGAQGLCSNPSAGLGQCWYDQIVYSPPGHPDKVYIGGVYVYGEQIANHRAVILSEDAGTSWYDMTEDVTDDVHPNQLHPDQHALVTHPDNPYLYFEVGDGGLVRSSGQLTNRSGVCASRGFTNDPAPSTVTAAQKLARCQQMLSKVPTKLESMNKGLLTLQFYTLSASPFNSKIIQGGTQDNGTWETGGNPNTWLNTNISDGGNNGFDAAIPEFRFSMFFAPQVFVNYSNGSDADWLWIADRFFTPGTDGGIEPQPFYTSVISDPVVSRSMYAGTGHAFRTKTHGQGALSLADFRARCNLWTGDFAGVCGDWATLGDPTVRGMLIHGDVLGCFGTQVPPAVNPPQVCPPPYPFGTDRDGGNVSWVERAEGDTKTLWAGTSLGRVFISKNADAADPATVLFDRIDVEPTNDPGRFVTGIDVDPANSNRAFITYSGYDAANPALPAGHVFEVVYNETTGTATWTRLDDGPGGLPDTPATDVAYDHVTGNLYVSNDFGVVLRPAGSATWVEAAEGMPNVMVPSLTLMAGERILYAASHGFGAWRLNLG